MKKVIMVLVIIALIFSVISFPTVSAKMVEKDDVIIDPGESVDEWLLWCSKDDEISFEIVSDRPVNIYIIADEYYGFELDDEARSRAEYSNTYVKTLNFKWTQPDDKNYNFIIENPSDEDSAIVSYKYTDILEEKLDEAADEICSTCAIVTIIGVIIAIVVGILIYKKMKSKKKEKPGSTMPGLGQPMQQYPQQPYPQQFPPQPPLPPQQPGFNPMQPGQRQPPYQ